MANYRPVSIRPRTGEQRNGHQTYHIGVPWQIAEAIPTDQKFTLVIDAETGVMTYTPTTEPVPLVSREQYQAHVRVLVKEKGDLRAEVEQLRRRLAFDEECP